MSAAYANFIIHFCINKIDFITFLDVCTLIVICSIHSNIESVFFFSRISLKTFNPYIETGLLALFWYVILYRKATL